MKIRPKWNMFASGFCLGGVLFTFRLNPTDWQAFIAVFGILGFLLNFFLGLRR